jgi:hypothetical protein
MNDVYHLYQKIIAFLLHIHSLLLLEFDEKVNIL